MDEVLSTLLKFVFVIFLTIGSTFTAGMTANTPMEEKKRGLRHMMRLQGLTSFQYYFGLLLADWIISIIPAAVASLLLIGFDDIMERQYIPEFLALHLMFLCSLNVLSYLFAHMFDNPETGSKYMSLLYIIGLFVAPFGLSFVLGLIIGEDESIAEVLTFWYFFSPLCTFLLCLMNVSFRGRDNFSPFLVSGDGQEVAVPLSVGVLAY